MAGRTYDMLTSYLGSSAYVLVKRNEFHVRHLESGAEATIQATRPFTTTRLLIGDFTAAESLLRGALKQVSKAGFFSPSPAVVIQPLEMIDGGLSQVEERILLEVAIGAGAFRAVVWVGPHLSDAEVKAKLKGKKRAV